MSAQYFFKILVYFSPLILMCLMLGNAIMSGSPVVFLIYLSALYLSGLIRFIIYYLGEMSTKNKPEQMDHCRESMSKYIYTPLRSYSYSNNLSTFVFVFTIFYMFFPSGSFNLSSSAQLTMFIFLIIYLVYDLVMRSIIMSMMPGCPSVSWTSATFKIVLEGLLGGLFGFLTSTGIQSIGLGNYLYFSSNKNNPTKKVFRCGKISK
jgi:hypothetical protein